MYQKSDIIAISLIFLVSISIYANSLSGEFVYDDTRQIARNVLIQDKANYGKALISDVWAFKGDGTIAASNYWRPVFTALNILAFLFFGLEPFGWHVLNILLHAGVCMLGYALLRRWKLSQMAAFAIALIFAVHPVHVESVAWIAGSPDLLFSLFLLAALWFAQNYAEKRNSVDLGLAILFYSLSLGSKEVAFLCFPLFWFIFSQSKEGTDVIRANPLRQTMPFAAAAILYVVFRWIILGKISHPNAGSISLEHNVLSIPAVFLFYLKQILLPVSLGVNYPIRPVESIDIQGFILPLAVSLIVIAFLVKLANRDFVQRMGLLIFVLPLIPAMNLTAFFPEQFVHDRYLYLPLLGFLMMIVPAAESLVQRVSEDKAPKIVLLLAIIAGIPLGLKTWSQNQVLATETLLWSHTVKIDGNSSYNWSQYGAALEAAGMHKDALEAYDSSLKINPSSLANLGRGRAYLHLGRFDEAVRDLKGVLVEADEEANAYLLYQAYEALAIAFVEQRKFDEAVTAIEEARRRLPVYFAALTEKLAVIYYQKGSKEDALRELEGARARAAIELLPESKAVLLRLGMLYYELGKKEQAREDLNEYLTLTAPLRDNLTMGYRKQAIDLLNRIN